MADDNIKQPQQDQQAAAPENRQDINKTQLKTAQKPELALIGQEISGCVILEKISEGGMGTVFKAKHKALDRIVCVKVLSPALANDKKAVGLFLTEARAIAEIDHPNIVFVYNVGKENGFYFIVMSFIEGESLSSIVRKRPNLPISFVVETFIGILRGLEAAHQKGIIHRDIKPSNILINKKLEPKIVDFGIAKKVDKDKGCTKTTELAGTAYFLSPEQALGRAIDTRADLYSVGASLFYVLTGKYPFTGKNSMDIIQKHINEPVPDINQYRKGIPPWLSLAVAKLMSKNPKDRFQTATETLLYFQKMRADDQLKLSQGVNITEEVGLKISSVEAPRADDAKNPAKRQSSNRFNMDVESTASRSSTTRPSIPIVSLGDRMPTPTPVPSPVGQTLGEATLTQKFIEERKKQIFGSNPQNAIDPTAALKAKKNKFLIKGLSLTFLAAFMMIAAAVLFLKLGTACSSQNIAGLPFFKALIAPWLNNGFMAANMPLAATAFVFFIFAVSMLFFDIINKAVPIVLLIAAWAYTAGLFGWADHGTAINIMSHSYLIVYAFVFGALAIKIDDVDAFGFLYRVITMALFAVGFWCMYQFCRPENAITGELTTSLFYSTMGLAAATFVLPLLRGSYILRIAAVLLFVSGCASVWVYQTSGSTYYMVQEIYQTAGVEPLTVAPDPNAVMLVPKKSTDIPVSSMFDAEAEETLNKKPVSLDNISIENYTTTDVKVNVLTKEKEQPKPQSEAEALMPTADEIKNLPAAKQPVQGALGDLPPGIDPKAQNTKQPYGEKELFGQAAAQPVAAAEPQAKAEAPKPLIPPAQQREQFIAAMVQVAGTKTKADIEAQVWAFALKEPFEKLRYTYKQDGLIFFTIIALIGYGIIMFIIAVLAAREERWNLI